MKTRINVKSSRNKKYKLKQKIIQKTRKQIIRKHNDKITMVNKIQHIFYISKCESNYIDTLDSSFLYKHLVNLGLQPDNKTMFYVRDQHKKIAATNKLSMYDYCNKFEKKYVVKIPNNLVKADVFFYDIINKSLLDKPFYDYKKYLSNTFNLDYYEINKGAIYKNIQKYNKQEIQKNPDILNHFIKTSTLSEYGNKFIPGIYILRPIHGSGGSDILYITNKKELDNAKKIYLHKKFLLDQITISKLITDLLLFNQRKFHLRVYFMIAILEGEISSFVLETTKILTAKKPYNLDLPLSKEVHDTHMDSSDADYFFPKDLDIPENDKTTINLGIRKIAKYLTNILIGICNNKPRTLLFENQENGYHIFGMDILVSKDLEPILVECNERPGMSTKKPSAMTFLSKTIYGWINETILEPLFKHPGKATQYARNHKTYISLDDF